MIGTKRTHAVLETGRTARRRWNAWEDAGGLLPVVAALALWAWVLAGVMAPLGHALARLDAGREPAAPVLACPLPPDALASASGAADLRRCR